MSLSSFLLVDKTQSLFLSYDIPELEFSLHTIWKKWLEHLSPTRFHFTQDLIATPITFLLLKISIFILQAIDYAL